MLEVLTCLLFVWHSVCPYKVLVVIPSPVFSHYQFGSEIGKGLAANNGHEVTVMAPFKQPKPLPNYEDLYLEDIQETTKTRMSIVWNRIFIEIEIIIASINNFRHWQFHKTKLFNHLSRWIGQLRERIATFCMQLDQESQ